MLFPITRRKFCAKVERPSPRKCLVFFIACFIAFYALPAVAAEMVSNLAESLGPSYPAENSLVQAQGFTTNGNNYLFTSVAIDVTDVIDNSGNFVIRIFTDNGGVPGTLLPNGLLVGPSNPLVGMNTYSASGDIVLVPNTTYWVTAQVSSGAGSYNLSFTDSLSQTGIWSILDHSAYSYDSGATWITADATSIMRMSVSSSVVAPQAVPTLNEWGYILLSLLMAGSAFWYLRRKRMVI